MASTRAFSPCRGLNAVPACGREAIARGVPVIASDPGGPAEMRAHEVNGLPVGPDNERARALAPGDPLEHPEKRQRLGEAARETVERATIHHAGKRQARGAAPAAGNKAFRGQAPGGRRLSE
jgi:glycosyl transferase family 1